VILVRARFEAKVRNVAFLAVIEDIANDIIAGRLEVATARPRIKVITTREADGPSRARKGGVAS